MKTRLTPPYTPQQAALLAEAMLTDSLQAMLVAPVQRRLLVLEGEPGPWLPPGIEVAPQGQGRLDERLTAAFALCTGPAVLIGMDTPHVTPAHLAPALAEDAWRDCDAWFGPAADGGFWALALAEPDPTFLRGVPMGVPDTGTRQRRRLTDAGLTVRELQVLRDVDTAADALAVAAEAPHTLFASTLAFLTPARPR
ncbi:DUF2064 domain-containing protein [Streptomyces sp. NPDC058622]|uniref:TIGR04282 family arsenosugar biosynthesis glycosyltransferase n=1 Tax=Streptomyces sp. NPDC058622 TaxID=3346562 RepID=UPI0036537285